jgi:hypothetical protein
LTLPEGQGGRFASPGATVSLQFISAFSVGASGLIVIAGLLAGKHDEGVALESAVSEGKCQLRMPQLPVPRRWLLTSLQQR